MVSGGMKGNAAGLSSQEKWKKEDGDEGFEIRDWGLGIGNWGNVMPV